MAGRRRDGNPAGLGHLCHFILSINIASGLGYREHAMDRLRTAMFATLWVSSALLLWGHLRAPFWTWSWPAYGYAVLCVITGAVDGRSARWSWPCDDGLRGSPKSPMCVRSPTPAIGRS